MSPITITVEVPIDFLTKAATEAVRVSLEQPTGYYRGGSGYNAIAKQVEAAIAAIDYAPMITEAITAWLKPTVEDVVKEALRKKAAKAVKAWKMEASQ